MPEEQKKKDYEQKWTNHHLFLYMFFFEIWLLEIWLIYLNYNFCKEILLLNYNKNVKVKMMLLFESFSFFLKADDILRGKVCGIFAKSSSEI